MSILAVDIHTLALHKLTEALGPTRAQQLLGSFLTKHNCARLSTAAELSALASSIEREGQPEQTIGAALQRYAKLLSS
jgi:hypothetical protein